MKWLFLYKVKHDDSDLPIMIAAENYGEASKAWGIDQASDSFLEPRSIKKIGEVLVADEKK
jgi:hypothetical protein